MNKEAIETRLTQLRRSLADIQANYAATQGAIQDCEHWLAWLDAQGAAADPPPPLPPAEAA